jgi:hypothetical protein
MKRVRAKARGLEHVGEAGAAIAKVAVAPAIAETPATIEASLAVAEKRTRRPRAKIAAPETAEKATTARRPRKATKLGSPSVAETPPSVERETVAVVQKHKRKPRAKPAVARAISDDAKNFANLVDSLRGRVARGEDAAPDAALPPAAIELFERCARDYQRESDKLVHRRRCIGALIYPASPGQSIAIGEWFVQATGLRIVDIDMRSLALLSDGAVADRLVPLAEPTARIVTIRGIGRDANRRVLAAISSANVDVLVIAFADPDMKPGMGLQRRLRYRIDLAQGIAIDVVAGCFDGSHAEPLGDGPAEAIASVPAAESPAGKYRFIERIVSFLRAGIRTAGL